MGAGSAHLKEHHSGDMMPQCLHISIQFGWILGGFGVLNLFFTFRD